MYDASGYLIREVELIYAHIANYKEVFETLQSHRAGKLPGMSITIKVLSAIQRIDKIAVNVYRWNYSLNKLLEDYTPVQNADKDIEEIFSIKWQLKDGRKINQNKILQVQDASKVIKDYEFSDFCYGQQVKLYVKTKHMAGKTVNIAIQSNDGTFKQEFKELLISNNEAVETEAFIYL